MCGATRERPAGAWSLKELVRRFKPTRDHLAAAQREVLLAIRASIDTQIELLEEWRQRHRRPEPLDPRNAR